MIGFIILVFLTTIVTCDANPADERAALDDVQSLLAFKAQVFLDSNGVLSNWDADSPNACNWMGITCSTRHKGRVEQINLSNNGLSGSLPLELGNVSMLQVLDLSYNQLAFGIPFSIGRLSALRYLSLGSNNLGLNIPQEIGNLSSLRFLDLADNGFNGTIPSSLGRLQSLQWLNVSNNQRLSGAIPSELGALQKLQSLNLEGNTHYGAIPASLGNCSQLSLLDLSNNNFSGSIPFSLGNNLQLFHVDFSYNILTGSLPSRLISISSLKELIISHNMISGRILEGISGSNSSANYSFLQRLDLSYNRLEGAIPTFLCKLPELEVLDLSHNQLVSGTSGPNQSIPVMRCFPNFSKLQILRLEQNNLEGTLPSNMGSTFQKLTELSLSNNIIRGNIPRTLGNISGLSTLELAHNRLEGHIPEELAPTFRTLSSLDLSGNRLSGSFPDFIWKFHSLYNLDLSGNSISGEIPAKLSQLVALQYLDLACNKLSGSITALSMPEVQYLNMSFNRLSDELPKSIGENLDVIDLSHNMFTGPLPDWVFDYSANLSYNDLEGDAPCGYNPSSFVGNPRLRYGCKNSTPTPRDQRSSSKSRRVILSASILGSFTVLIFVGVLILFSKVNAKSAQVSRRSTDGQFIFLSEDELISATDNFSSRNLLGRGRFGSVFRGVLTGGLTVAIKFFHVFEDESAEASFLRECETLGKIRHRNLVKIITAYSAEGVKALVLQFMPNGSLDALLHHPIDANGRLMPLSFRTRIRLLKEVASALSYLHNYCTPPIAHCDVKPQNVLLDEDMTARLSDFETARVIGDSDPSGSLTLQGSIGYIPPEYGTGVKAWIKGDVFSFGILILETMSRIRPTDPRVAGGTTTTLAEWMWKVLQGGRESLKKNVILRDGQKELQLETEEDFERMEKVLRLGVLCTNFDPARRPTMRQVETTLAMLPLSPDFCYENDAEKIMDLERLLCTSDAQNHTSRRESSDSSF